LIPLREESLIQKMSLGGKIMSTWRKKFFGFLLALIAISILAGPIAVSTAAASAPAAQHGKRHHHRRHHRKLRHHR
jgi:Ni/Co efflux regulator RcnB